MINLVYSFCWLHKDPTLAVKHWQNKECFQSKQNSFGLLIQKGTQLQYLIMYSALNNITHL